MRPDRLRNHWRFTGCSAATLTLASTAPALAAYSNTAIIGNAPLTIAIGAGAFAVLAMLALRRRVRDGETDRLKAAGQIAGLRAQLDEYEALLSGAREITVLWGERNGPPKVLGQTSALLPQGKRPDALLDFPQWLADADIDPLDRALEGLRVGGESFALDLRTRDGRAIRATGAVTAGGAALRLRPDAGPAPAAPERKDAGPEARALLAGFELPAFLGDANGQLVYANPAHARLAVALGTSTAPGGTPGVLDPTMLERHLKAVMAKGRAMVLPLTLPVGAFDLIAFPVGGGTAGYLQPKPQLAAEAPPRQGRTAALVEALSIPVAIFDAGRQLLAFNAAYAALWKLGDWLKPGLDERAILDRLRRDGQLPSESDYQAWRTRHLAAYSLTARRPPESWHLPDGRTLNVTAAPAGPEGGVIYLFEDISRELELVSQNKAMASVQRSTINALSEAVAVFGTNGRLQLFNPRMSALWKLPTNFLDQSPHVDQIADTVARALPEDGAAIWRSLKRDLIDLTPTRSDSSGRLTRSDGRLIDYAVVGLPDGQKLLTFLDVTESANYSRVLKERNDALVTADRLKDAFVQNVSYELRSPLTNIIGFADLLASPEVGPLNERQHAYTDYIRASSVTLGVLIDNILDLATVDAGIAELRPEPQNVTDLVEKARAGIAATFPEIDGVNAINLHIDIDKNLPPLIADGTRLVQVLYNLLASAARFSEPGGKVQLKASSRGERMLFVVEDEGAPMSEDVRAAMLEDASNPTIGGRQRGEGLALAIVRAFVNLHGGTITVEKRQPRGSRVTVSLPLDAAAATHAAAE